MTEEIQKIYYIYRVTNLINNKIYIGQTVQPHKRWNQHKRDSRNPKVPFQFAIHKYGSENFNFEIIACCKTQEDANNTETQLVSYYNSLLPNGYNSTHGGFNAPKTDAWKASLKKWRDSLSEEEKQAIRDKQAIATKNQIETKGHPAQGHKWTDRQRQALSEWRLSVDQNAIFTPEVRKKMSDSHKGKVLPREVVEKIVASGKITRLKISEERYQSEDIRCHADGCEVKGKAKYKIINDVRYCNKHGLRVLRNGQAELLPRKPVIMSQEIRDKISKSKTGKNLGREPHNKMNLTEDQINFIINDSRSIMELSKELNIGRKVISRIRKEYRK